MPQHAAAPPKGIYPPCVTFMHDDESVDYDSITKHVLRLAAGGVVGLVIHGSNGEAVHLDNAERAEIIKHVRSTLDSNGYEKLVIIAGCGAPSKRATVQLTREAKQAGAAFVLVLPPNYWSAAMSKPVLLSYFKEVADESPLPVMLYNFPLVANGINLDSDTMIELAQHPNIVGTKLTCGNLGNLHRVAAHTNPDDFAVMSGKSEFALHGFVGGASSCIAALVNLFPKAHVALYNAIHSGDLAKARQIQNLLSDGDLAQSRLGIGGLKYAVSQFHGYGSGRTRRPLLDGAETSFAAQKLALQIVHELEQSL